MDSEMMVAKIKLRAQRRIGELSRNISKVQVKGREMDISPFSYPEGTKSKEDVLAEARLNKKASLTERFAAIAEDRLSLFSMPTTSRKAPWIREIQGALYFSILGGVFLPRVYTTSTRKFYQTEIMT